MIIPGFLISLLTFPGVIVHEAAHMLFCRLRRVPILDVCFFRLGNPCGYVMHAKTEDFTSSFLIAIGPFLVNSLLCLAICLPTVIPVRVFSHVDVLSVILLWLGVSIGMHAFPSTGDAKVLWSAAGAAARRWNPLAILSYPLVIVLYIVNFGRFFWLDLVYGIGLGVGLPMLLIEYLE